MREYIQIIETGYDDFTYYLYEIVDKELFYSKWASVEDWFDDNDGSPDGLEEVFTSGRFYTHCERIDGESPIIS